MRLIGKQAELLGDFSRLQINTAGTYKGKTFSVIGRLQMRYDAGTWNEWYLLFNDATTAWLSETASGFTLLMSAGKLPSSIPFEAVKPGQKIALYQESFNVTDKQVSECIAAQGELPFAANQQWQAKTLDLKSDKHFLTLDYSDGDPPEVYRGVALVASDLNLSLLKDTKDRFTGDSTLGAIDPKVISSLACKACGNPIKLSAATPHVVCGSCGSELHTQDGNLILDIEKANQQKIWTALSPGDSGELFGYEWMVLGVMIRHEVSDPSEKWEEYLLYHADQGLRWLVNASGQWQWTQVLDKEPQAVTSQAFAVDGDRFNSTTVYRAQISYVAGAFNWRAKAGDVASVSEYRQGEKTLARETTDSEVTWSLGQIHNGHTILNAFGKAPKVSAKTAYSLNSGQDDNQLSNTILVPTIIASAVLILLVSPAWLMARIDPPLEETLFGLLALWLPQYFISQQNSDDD